MEITKENVQECALLFKKWRVAEEKDLSPQIKAKEAKILQIEKEYEEHKKLRHGSDMARLKMEIDVLHAEIAALQSANRLERERARDEVDRYLFQFRPELCERNQALYTTLEKVKGFEIVTEAPKRDEVQSFFRAVTSNIIGVLGKQKEVAHVYHVVRTARAPLGELVAMAERVKKEIPLEFKKEKGYLFADSDFAAFTGLFNVSLDLRSQGGSRPMTLVLSTYAIETQIQTAKRLIRSGKQYRMGDID